ncbi:MAG: hypothetical protein CMN30_01830 [Sandaracinus sp.]|nr:hypothetical protein [Sandaracinus sp.]
MFAASLALPSGARAQDAEALALAESGEGAAPGEGPLPQRYSERPLVLPHATLAVVTHAGVRMDRRRATPDPCVATTSGTVCFADGSSASGRNFGRTSSGFGVGLLDVLEVGFVPIRVGSQLSPETGDTEIDFLDPWFYLAAAPLRTEHVHLGLSYGLFIPLQASTVLTQQPSIDLLVRSRYLRGDVSLYTRFDTPIRPSPFETGEQSTYVTPGFDVALVGQPLAGLGLLLGFRNELFDLEDHSLSIRAGVVGTVADSAGQALVDIRVTFAALDVGQQDAEVPGPRRSDGGSADPGALATSDGIRSYTLDASATFYFRDLW